MWHTHTRIHTYIRTRIEVFSCNCSQAQRVMPHGMCMSQNTPAATTITMTAQHRQVDSKVNNESPCEAQHRKKEQQEQKA